MTTNTAQGWPRRSTLLLALALVMGSTPGCNVQPTDSTAAGNDTAQAKDAVEKLFSAFANRDCGSLDRLLGGRLRTPLEKKGCTAMLKREPLTEATLVRVGEPVRDGRNRSAWTVSVTLNHEGRTSPVNVRVERRDGRYRVVAL